MVSYFNFRICARTETVSFPSLLFPLNNNNNSHSQLTQATHPSTPSRRTNCARNKSSSGCRQNTWGRATRTRRRGSGGRTSRGTRTRAWWATRRSSPTSPSPSTSPPPRSAPASSAPCSSPAGPRLPARATSCLLPPPSRPLPQAESSSLPGGIKWDVLPGPAVHRAFNPLRIIFHRFFHGCLLRGESVGCMRWRAGTVAVGDYTRGSRYRCRNIAEHECAPRLPSRNEEHNFTRSEK